MTHDARIDNNKSTAMRAPIETQAFSSMTGQAADHVQNLNPMPDADTLPNSGQNAQTNA